MEPCWEKAMASVRPASPSVETQADGQRESVVLCPVADIASANARYAAGAAEALPMAEGTAEWIRYALVDMGSFVVASMLTESSRVDA